ncbi:hypothetical protein LTR66_014067 [Elasticomyces elasticus]|nr:hypothetical protein LTR66_014067 [Elasticomyces elasticus]
MTLVRGHSQKLLHLNWLGMDANQNSAISKDDKATIRSRLVEASILELDDRLATQSALVYAKIVRYEYPQEWPNAISELVDLLVSDRTSPPEQIMRVILMLLYVTKELSLVRTPRTRQTLRSITPEIVRAVGAVWTADLQRWQAASATAQEENTLGLRRALLAIKVLRRICISGYDYPNRERAVQDFWQYASSKFALFLSTVRQKVLQPEDQRLLEAQLIQLAKLHLTMAQTHTIGFALLPNSVHLVREYWRIVKEVGESYGSKEAVLSAVNGQATIGTNGDAADGLSTLEQLALKGISIIRACIKLAVRPTGALGSLREKVAEDKAERAEATKLLKEQLLTRSFVQEAMEVTITRFFVFRESDLREWAEEPEEWEYREELSQGEGYEYSLRPASEKLFLDLASNYKDILIQPLLSVFNSVATSDNQDISFKDSVYTAIGLSAAVIHEQLDFDAFVRSTLVQEVQIRLPGYNILRRRIAILLGEWIAIKISVETRPLVYQIFQHLLDKDDSLNDQVVRVTAGRQLRSVVDEWEFDAEQFLPYAATILSRLMHLIQEVELMETKMALLNTISLVVERMEHRIEPFANSIVTLLPPLWEGSGEEHLMKQAILTILTRIVSAMKAASVPFHQMILPIIKGAVEPGSETQIYLLEDALELWEAILVQTPSGSISSDLLGLAPYLFAMFELGSENLRKALAITESYILLAPSDMLSDDMRKRLVASFASLTGTLKADASGVVTNLVENLLRAAELLGGEAAVSYVTADLVESTFLTKLLTGLQGSYIAHCTSGPLAKTPLVDGIVETDYYSVLARIALASPPTFVQAVQAALPEPFGRGKAERSTIQWLLQEWFDHFANVGDPGRRKLMALALTKLLETRLEPLLGNLQSLMEVWTDVVTELREEGEGGVSNDDSLLFTNRAPPALDDALEAPEDRRRRAMTYSDPVHTISLPAFIRHHLQLAVAAAGGDGTFWNEWVVNIDKSVVKSFAVLGIL